MSIGCGAGGSCCETCRGGGLGDASAPGSYPNIEAVLTNYVENMLASGQRFYISDTLNSDVLKGDGNFGFFPAIIAAIAGAAAAIGPTVTTAATIYGTYVASKGLKAPKGAAPSTQDIASAITPDVVAELKSRGITLPASVAGQVTQAGVMDMFGVNTKPILIAAAIGLAALLIMRRR